MATAPGFTIIELVVSIGILGILMVVAGSVFALTLKSSGQATALIDIHQSLRALEDSLREDLRGVSPSGSIMVIQSHAINSYWTDDAKEIDNNANPLDLSLTRDPQREKAVGATLEVERPRADMLMFFTSRPGTSFRDPEISGTLQQVVYGHALPGEWDLNKQWAPTITPPSGFVDAYAESSFTPNQLQYVGPADYQYRMIPSVSNPPVFAMSARNWHLFRRGVLIVDQDLSNPPNTFFPAAWLDDSAAKVTGNDDDPDYPSVPKSSYVRDGRRDYLVDGANPNAPEFVYNYDVVNRLKLPDADPSTYQPGEGPGFGPAYDVNGVNPEALVHMMPRALLDSAPPSNQVNRMGQFFLPHCASFRVEWALDMRDVIAHFDSDASFNQRCFDAKVEFLPFTKDVIWVDPLNFAETIEKMWSVIDQINMSATDPVCVPLEMPEFVEKFLGKLIFRNPTDYVNYPNPDRFAEISGGNVVPYDTHIFYANKPFSQATNPPQLVVDQPDPLFPKALRITVDVYDPADRLERPIRHVMVLPVGQ